MADEPAPRADEPAPHDDDTVRHEPVGDGSAPEDQPAPSDTTKQMPPVESTPSWSARASVPVRQPEPEVPQEEEMWGPPPRGLLVPVLITVCVLLLIALIALGIWLVARGGQGNNPGPVGTTTAVPTTPRTTVRTTRPPTTPPTTQPQQVAVPGVRNRPAEEAVQAVRDAGLNPIVQNRADAQIAEGRAIGTDPAAGAMLPPGTNVTVLISTGPPPPTETTVPPTTVPPT